MVINPEFEIGQKVFYAIAPERFCGLVMGYVVGRATLMYRVTWQDMDTDSHFDFELSDKFVPDFGVDE